MARMTRPAGPTVRRRVRRRRRSHVQVIAATTAEQRSTGPSQANLEARVNGRASVPARRACRRGGTGAGETSPPVPLEASTWPAARRSRRPVPCASGESRPGESCPKVAAGPRRARMLTLRPCRNQGREQQRVYVVGPERWTARQTPGRPNAHATTSDRPKGSSGRQHCSLVNLPLRILRRSYGAL